MTAISRRAGVRTKVLGDRGERIAARHLKRAGYRVIGRNVRTRIGEIDILAIGPAVDRTLWSERRRWWARVQRWLVGAGDGRPIVVVEVKTRVRGAAADRAERDTAGADGSGGARGGEPIGSRSPESAITARKAAKLRALLRHICHANGWSGRTKRIDVVAIDVPEEGPPVVRLYRDAVGDAG